MLQRHWTTLAVAALAVGGLMPGSGATHPPGWSIVPTPDPVGSAGAYLTAVSCVGVGSCTAVGGTGRHALAEHWNGSHWTLVKAPSVGGSRTDTVLTGLSCVGATWCTAVGYSVVSSEQTVVVRTLAEAWNGSRWNIQATPVAAGPGSATTLASVSCVAYDSCEAVGALTKAGADAQTQPLAEHWNGTAWKVQTTPNPHAENGSSLAGLSCTAADACTAGGEYDYADVGQSVFAFRWNGRTWRQESQPNPSGQSFNTEVAVSCATSSSCTSVGTWTTGADHVVTFAEAWNGSTWARQRTPDPAEAEISDLAGVSCVTPAACTAVGESSDNGNSLPSSTLAAAWNGTAWAGEATPDPAGSRASGLDDVSCVDRTTCMAVGSSYDGHTTTTLAESYSG